MDKSKLLTKLHNIYKIIDALMIAAFVWLTSILLLAILYQNFDPLTIPFDTDQVSSLAKIFKYHTYIVGWITITRVLTAFKIFFFPRWYNENTTTE